MDDSRDKKVTGGGKGIKLRGEVKTDGPVGREDGYANRPKDDGGNRAGGDSRPGNRPSHKAAVPGVSGQSVPQIKLSPKTMLVLIVVGIIVLLVVGYMMKNADNTSEGGGSTSLSNLLGFTGSNNVSSGWDEGTNNTGKLNTEVDPSARARYTTIKGNGEDTVTIMIYTCGTDLESRAGMASNDIAEMCNATLSKNINILIYTGGCKQWKTSGISSSTNQIYKISNGKLAQLVSDDGSKVMTDPDTLTYFIKWCKSKYPADRNMLIFWDHGGGSLSGYGYDEKYASKGSMSLSGINKALKNADMKFDFIGFDACLMATLETALVTANYADYLIASEETEPGIGWYYTDWLNELSKNTSQPTIEIGKNIIDGFVDECAKKCKGQQTTLSIIDLAELSQTVPDKLGDFSTDTSKLIKGNDYKKVSDARAGSREFASSSKIDQVDLVNFANKLGTDDAKALSQVLLSAIKYNRTSSNMTNAYGLSIYFPYKKASKVDNMVSTYDDIGMDEDYAKCIKSFAGLETTGQIAAGGSSSPASSLLGGGGGDGTQSSDALSSLLNAFLGGGRSIEGIDRDATSFMDDSDCFNAEEAVTYISANQFDSSKLKWKEYNGKQVIELADEEWAKIQSLQLNIFYDTGDGYVDLGLDSIYKFEDGRLVGETDNTWLSIDSQPVAYYYEGTIKNGNEKIVRGRVPALVNGERCNLIIVFDGEHPDGYIAGARYDYVKGETDTVAKSLTELQAGDTIDFICDYYSYSGIYQSSFMLGDQLIYKDGLLISNTDIGGSTRVTYLLTDMYNNEYWTPVMPK
ncbi:MAG: peptidase C11 [Lachnospiraceae bacterium]|nr:peptidase C11 [Lachnospiraceae bacterium]